MRETGGLRAVACRLPAYAIRVASVLYRSVLLASENGTRYACATIMPKGQANVTVLKVRRESASQARGWVVSRAMQS